MRKFAFCGTLLALKIGTPPEHLLFPGRDIRGRQQVTCHMIILSPLGKGEINIVLAE